MTGELFNLLREHSILADQLSGAAEAGESRSRAFSVERPER